MNSSDATYATLLLEEPIPGVTVITLNRPGRLNAMTVGMFRELEQVATSVDADEDCRAVVLTGVGDAFCAGYDLDDASELPNLGALGMLDHQEVASRALVALRSLRVPVLAAINGAAAGGGLSLALAADIRIASTQARFRAAFIRIGLSAGDLGASWLLTRLIGPGATNELCFTGRIVESAEALELGLVNSIVQPGDLVEEALAVARSIVANSPGGVQLSKRALQANLEAASYAAALELENRGQALLTRSPDMSEALAAFREKRLPVFTGA